MAGGTQWERRSILPRAMRYLNYKFSSGFTAVNKLFFPQTETPTTRRAIRSHFWH